MRRPAADGRDDIRDCETEDGLDAGCPLQAFPERGGCVDAGGGSRACGCTHEDLLFELSRIQREALQRNSIYAVSSNERGDVCLSKLEAMSVFDRP